MSFLPFRTGVGALLFLIVGQTGCNSEVPSPATQKTSPQIAWPSGPWSNQPQGQAGQGGGATTTQPPSPPKRSLETVVEEWKQTVQRADGSAFEGDMRKAEELLDKAFQLVAQIPETARSAFSAQTHLATGTFYSLVNLADEAEKHFESALDHLHGKRPDELSSAAHLGLATAQYQQREFEKALHALSKAGAAPNAAADAARRECDRGRILCRLSRFEPARQALQKANRIIAGQKLPAADRSYFVAATLDYCRRTRNVPGLRACRHQRDTLPVADNRQGLLTPPEIGNIDPSPAKLAASERLEDLEQRYLDAVISQSADRARFRAQAKFAMRRGGYLSALGGYHGTLDPDAMDTHLTREKHFAERDYVAALKRYLNTD